MMIHYRIAAIAGAALCIATGAGAQSPQKLNIEQATVFLSGAELLSTAHVNLVKGENDVVFTNVAGDVNSQSLTINATNGVVVEAATFQNNYLAAEVLSPRAKELKDSLELMTEGRAAIANKIAVLNEQITILQGNRKVGGENTGLSVAELTKMLDLVNTRMEGYLGQKNKQEALLKKADERLVKLNKQLEEEQQKGYQPGGQLLVRFYAKEATASAITIDYVVPHAGWTPTYDIWADNVNGPIKLFYKANIYQNSGVKWNNVRLSLSTGNPNEGVQAPVMNPWYLSFYAPQMYNQGLTNAQAPAPPMAYKKGLMDKAERTMTMNAEQTSIDNYVSVDNSGVNTTFDIELPYTIPSDGQQHLVAVKRYELPATYRYYTVPKLDKDAFLQANITNWEDLNLLPGQTNIFYEGSYVGRGNIDVRNVKDTMTISLGRDKKIVVKRERDVKLRSVKTIGTNVRETAAFNITIRNTRKEAVTLVVQDQIPVSNDKDIVIEDKDLANAEYDELTGAMKWTVTLAANETRKITFGYTVKYPKGKVVNGLR